MLKLIVIGIQCLAVRRCVGAIKNRRIRVGFLHFVEFLLAYDLGSAIKAGLLQHVVDLVLDLFVAHKRAGNVLTLYRLILRPHSLLRTASEHGEDTSLIIFQGLRGAGCRGKMGMLIGDCFALIIVQAALPSCRRERLLGLGRGRLEMLRLFDAIIASSRCASTKRLAAGSLGRTALFARASSMTMVAGTRAAVINLLILIQADDIHQLIKRENLSHQLTLLSA